MPWPVIIRWTWICLQGETRHNFSGRCRVIICLGGGVAARHLNRVFVLVLGWALIALGVVGLFVPILQGILFIILGLLVLSRESRTARFWLDRLAERFPTAHERARKVKDKLRYRFGGGPRSQR